MEDIGLLSNNEEQIKELLDQHPILWLFELFTNGRFSNIAFSNVDYEIFHNLQLNLNGNIVITQSFYLSFEGLWSESFEAIETYLHLTAKTDRSSLLLKFLESLKAAALKNNHLTFFNNIESLLVRFDFKQS